MYEFVSLQAETLVEARDSVEGKQDDSTDMVEVMYLCGSFYNYYMYYTSQGAYIQCIAVHVFTFKFICTCKPCSFAITCNLCTVYVHT